MTIKRIPRDVIKYNIYPFLSYRDKLVLNLAGVKPIFDFRTEFSTCINYRLKKLGLNEKIIDDIFTLIKSRCAVISGSFILQCIYNETYDGSDIDIFDYLDDYYEFGMHNADYITPISKYLSKISDSEELFALDRNLNVYGNMQLSPSYFTVGKAKINYIRIYKNSTIPNIYTYIDKNFDLDCCKCTYDAIQLKIFDIKGVINKEIIINTNKYAYNHPLIINITNHELRLRLFERAYKYVRRGFNITHVVLGEEIISEEDKIIIQQRRRQQSCHMEHRDHFLQWNKNNMINKITEWFTNLDNKIYIHLYINKKLFLVDLEKKITDIFINKRLFYKFKTDGDIFRQLIPSLLTDIDYNKTMLELNLFKFF